MRDIAKFLFLILFLTINTQASFERSFGTVANQALGNSASALFLPNVTRAVSVSRNFIMPTMLESIRVSYEQSFQELDIGFYYNSFGDPKIGTGFSYIERVIATKMNYAVGTWFFLAGEIRKHTISSKYEQQRLTGNGYGVDLGLKIIASPRFNIVFEKTNLGGHIKYNTGRIEDLEENVFLMLETSINKNSTVFLKADRAKEINIGYKVDFNDELTLFMGNSCGNWAGGFAINKNNYSIKYACSYDLAGTQQLLGLTRAF